ncbi:MAG: UDP-N-acetylmuramate dehydrogenase [Rhodospirillum sp.]|nr:UDP-N-acetylmuramate dehydrogenase [Rhodospirillum sp.]MCF8488804.1 UDP-N-acetylmuramate dehydrogenase [Rhodospirillum sp.]
MMSTQAFPSDLMDRLPPVRGRLTANAPLASVTWFQVGGPAEVLFKPKDQADLAEFLANRPADLPVLVLGVASNLLVRDGGVPGVVIRLGRAFADIAIDGETITCGAAVLDGTLAKMARDAGLAGLEFLSGIPGTIGGALRMNAGAHGGEMKDIVVSATAMDSFGQVYTLTPERLRFSYRHCGIPEDWIFTRCVLKGRPDSKTAISTRMEAIRVDREEAQPIRARTGGSTFANPDPKVSGGRRAWQLIDEAGCRGLTLGGAQVSEKHCNFLINTGSATATDLETLGETVRARVLAATGVALIWEIRRVGQRLDTPREILPPNPTPSKGEVR